MTTLQAIISVVVKQQAVAVMSGLSSCDVPSARLVPVELEAMTTCALPDTLGRPVQSVPMVTVDSVRRAICAPATA